MFQTADEHEAAAQAGAAWFPEWLYRSSRTDTIDHGVMGPGFDEWAAGKLNSSAFVLEFGTHEPVGGIGVFRADNWLHSHGDPTSETGLTVRQRMRDFFFVEDEGWRRDVADAGLASLHAGLDGIIG